MPRKPRRLSEQELAKRRAIAESIDRGVEEIRRHVAKVGPPDETITETLRRLRGGSRDGRP
jgi:hypothetical protein